jgi:hypothetical protein
MKYSVLACKDLTDVVRETAVLHEYNAKVISFIYNFVLFAKIILAYSVKFLEKSNF